MNLQKIWFGPTPDLLSLATFTGESECEKRFQLILVVYKIKNNVFKDSIIFSFGNW